MTAYTGINTLTGLSAIAVPNTGTCVVCSDNTTPNPTNGVMSATFVNMEGWAGEYTGFNALTPPGVTYFQNLFQLYYADQNGNIQRLTSPDGSTWTSQKSIGLSTSGGISATPNGDVLHIFYRDADGGGVFHATSTDGATFTGSEYLGINTQSGLSSAVASGLVVVTCQDNGGGGIMTGSLSPTAGWSTQYIGFNTSADPGITALNGTFHMYNRDPGGGGIFHHTSTDGVKWSGNTYEGFNTSGACAPVVIGSTISLFYRDPSGGGVMVTNNFPTS